METEKRNTQILKVGKNTVPNALKTAIVGYLKSGNGVVVDSIGEKPHYIATKAVIMARGQLYAQGLCLRTELAFSDIKIDNPRDKEVKTAVRYTLSV